MERTELEGPATSAPMVLASLHRRTIVGEVVDVETRRADIAARLPDLLVGAGFEVGEQTGEDGWCATRLRSLPDTVGPGMRMLVCGLNPSELAADAGVGFARPGNRFWPAAIAAGLVSVDRDPDHALTHHGIGMTDLVKRATPGAAELTPDEYRAGLARIERLTKWLGPGVVCFVGFAGWRAAADRTATASVQATRLGGRPVYVMPSTSGRNAHATLDDLVDHLGAAADVAEREREGHR